MRDGKVESRSVWKLGDGGWYGRDLSLIKGEGKEGTFGALSYKRAKDLRRWNHSDSPLWSVTEQRVRDNSARDSALSHHFKSWLWIEKPWICATTTLLARSRYAEGWGWNIKINAKYSTFHTKWAKWILQNTTRNLIIPRHSRQLGWLYYPKTNPRK